MKNFLKKVNMRHNFSRLYWCGLVTVVVMTGVCIPVAQESGAHARLVPTIQRKPAPDFALKDSTGKQFTLKDYRGKLLLLDFWATWCGPCKIEIPGFIELYDKYRGQGFAAVGVVVQDRFPNAAPFVRDNRMNYPVLDGENRDDLEQAFGPFYGLPTSFIIARDGRICQKHVGLPQTRRSASGTLETAVRDRFEAEIKSLL